MLKRRVFVLSPNSICSTILESRRRAHAETFLTNAKSGDPFSKRVGHYYPDPGAGADSANGDTDSADGDTDSDDGDTDSANGDGDGGGGPFCRERALKEPKMDSGGSERELKDKLRLEGKRNVPKEPVFTPSYSLSRPPKLAVSASGII